MKEKKLPQSFRSLEIKYLKSNYVMFDYKSDNFKTCICLRYESEI